MGYYTTNAAVTGRLSERTAANLTVDTGSSPDTVMIDDVIIKQEGIVESFLSRYPLPIATGTKAYDAVAEAVLICTGYKLYLRRPPVPEDWRKAFEETMAWLKLIASGDLDLPRGESESVGFESGSETQLGTFDSMI